MKQLQVKKHMMTAISYLIPFVCAAGMLMVIGNIAGGTSVTDFSKQLAIPDLLTTLGGQALGFLPVVISTGIAYSIADKAGIAPGVIMGILCKADGYGFLGGLISGFLVGYLTAWLIKVIKVPQWIAGLLPQLILPLLGSLIVGLVMQYVIGVPIVMLTNAITGLLVSMQSGNGSLIIFGLVIGILSAVDYGGPINKVVFVFASGVMSEGMGEPIAILIMASMIAPFGLTLGYLFSKLFHRDIYSKQEVDNLKSAFIMGCCQITEGSYPIILNDLLRITICTAAGAGVAGAMAAVFKVSSKVPAGGFFALPGINYSQYWLLSLLVGSVVFGLLIQVLKRKPNEEEVEGEKEINLSDLKIS